MSKQQIPNKILWLASYPKSGNTWFRAFLTALLNEGAIEINKMDSDGILSSRTLFDNISDIDSRDLYDEEVKNLYPLIYRTWAPTTGKLNIVKVHDAFHMNEDGEPIMPEDVTHCAIYLIRNPLDVVASFAHHSHTTIDVTIDLMNNPKGRLAKQKNNLNINSQFSQLMYDWSGHVQSWATLPKFPVHFIKYEDMLASPLETFRDAVQKIGWDYDDDTIQKAIDASSFKNLKQQESEKGFKEKTAKSDGFFRQGKAGNWVNELTPEQIEKIITVHKDVMAQYGY